MATYKTLSNFTTPRAGFISTRSRNSLYHEPHPQQVRVFILQHPWNPSAASEHLDDPVPSFPPLIKSARSSLLWEGAASTPYSVFPLCDVPIELADDSKEAKALGTLRSLDDGQAAPPRSPLEVFFRTSVSGNQKEAQSSAGKLTKTWYDLVDRSTGKEQVLAAHAGWTFTEGFEDCSELSAYHDHSIVRRAAEAGSAAGSLLFAVNQDVTLLEWFDEDQRRLGTHVKNPYHRVDALPSSRHVQVFLRNDASSSSSTATGSQPILLAETSAAVLVFETGLPVRAYLPASAILSSACELTPLPTSGTFTDLVTICGYKGAARYYDVTIKSTGERIPNLVWTYPRALAESKAAEGLLAFYAPGPRCILVIDGEVTSV